MTEEIPGIQSAEVEGWIAERVRELTPPFTWMRFAAGHSNLTYRIEDATGRAAVVRRPPLGKLLPKAHDMGREYRILSALDPTPVPVPRPLAFCEDGGVTGAPFYVMAHVDGRALASLEAGLEIPETERSRTAESFIDALAELHSLEPAAVGLAELGRPDHYVDRQLHRWYESWKASAAAAEIDVREVHELHDWLCARVPEQGPARVVHGDYGLHNCLIGSDSRVAAVVDWEISTLGDPLADLGYALNAWAEPGDDLVSRDLSPTLAPGFPDRRALLERYVGRTGADASGIAYYRAFNHWKTACIVQGVYARYRKGQKSAEGVDLDGMAVRVHRAIELASRSAAALE